MAQLIFQSHQCDDNKSTAGNYSRFGWPLYLSAALAKHNAVICTLSDVSRFKIKIWQHTHVRRHVKINRKIWKERLHGWHQGKSRKTLSVCANAQRPGGRTVMHRENKRENHLYAAADISRPAVGASLRGCGCGIKVLMMRAAFFKTRLKQTLRAGCCKVASCLQREICIANLLEASWKLPFLMPQNCSYFMIFPRQLCQNISSCTHKKVSLNLMPKLHTVNKKVCGNNSKQANLKF